MKFGSRRTILGVIAIGMLCLLGLSTTTRGQATQAAQVEEAERSKADLMVIGSSWYSAVERMILGSTATKLVEKCEIPLLVVPRGGV